MNIENKIGPRILPLGTLQEIEHGEDRTLLIRTCCLRSERYELIRCTNFLSKPNFSSLKSNLLCETLSNAFLKSKYTHLKYSFFVVKIIELINMIKHQRKRTSSRSKAMLTVREFLSNFFFTKIVQHFLHYERNFL